MCECYTSAMDGVKLESIRLSGIEQSVVKSHKCLPPKRKALGSMIKVTKIRKIGKANSPAHETTIKAGAQSFIENKSCWITNEQAEEFSLLKNRTSLMPPNTSGQFSLLRNKTSLMNETKARKFQVLKNKTWMKNCERGKLRLLRNRKLAIGGCKPFEQSSLRKKPITNNNTAEQLESQRWEPLVTWAESIRLITPRMQMTSLQHGDTIINKSPSNSTSQTGNSMEKPTSGETDTGCKAKSVESENENENSLRNEMLLTAEDPREMLKNKTSERKEPYKENLVKMATTNERRRSNYLQCYDNLSEEYEKMSSAVMYHHDRKSPSDHPCERQGKEFLSHRMQAELYEENITNNSVDRAQTASQHKTVLAKTWSSGPGQYPTDTLSLQLTHRDTSPANLHGQKNEHNRPLSPDTHQPISNHETDIFTNNQPNRVQGMVTTSVSTTQNLEGSVRTGIATTAMEDWAYKDRNDNAGQDDGISNNIIAPSFTRRASVTDQYDLLHFNSTLGRFKELLLDARFHKTEGEYPADDLKKLITVLDSGLKDYRQHAQETQTILNEVFHVLKTLRTTLSETITAPLAAQKGPEDQKKSAETLELEALASELTASMAEAHERVAEASEVAAQATATAVQHRLAANQAAEEAQRIQEELARQAEIERQKREEEERRRLEEEKRKKEEEERRLEEERKAKEALLFKQKQEAGAKSGSELEAGPEECSTLVYPDLEGSDCGDIYCIIRTSPPQFQYEDLTCDVIPQENLRLVYKEQEELISKIVRISPVDLDKADKIDGAYLVAMPCLGRLPQSRESVMKALRDGVWEDLVTTEVAFEKHKEYKFAQAEIKEFTTFLVMSRFKRDYVAIPRMKRIPIFKVTSSYDHRVNLTLKRGTFEDKQNLIMHVQPVESSYVNEFRRSDAQTKRLLATSPVLHTDWEDASFGEPIRIALPCPPNPATAKKIALAKKQKEDKLVAPKIPGLPPEDVSKPAKKPAVPPHQVTQDSGGQDAEGRPTGRSVQNKWYMGQYGLSEDDEHDQLCLMTFSSGKWYYASSIEIRQSRVDLVTFNLDTPCERLMVLRTVKDVEEDSLKQLANRLMQHLGRRSVYFIVKQNLDDLYDVCCHVVPSWNLERMQKTLKEKGFTEGSDHPVCVGVLEGEVFTLALKGNLQYQDPTNVDTSLIYNSNLPTGTTFRVTEKDKYLQRNFEVFRGALEILRRKRTPPPSTAKNRRLTSVAENTAQLPQFFTLCTFYIDIPKDHLETDPVPTRVPMKLPPTGPLNSQVLHSLAEDIGEEWQELGEKLNLDKVRIQAIVRLAEGTEDQAKYEMLMAWFKRCPQAADKVIILSNALLAVGRRDLFNQLRFSKKKSNVQAPWRVSTAQ